MQFAKVQNKNLHRTTPYTRTNSSTLASDALNGEILNGELWVIVVLPSDRSNNRKSM